MIKERQLKNGLKVLFVESRKSPVISVQMWVRTGSADESPSTAGISHFIEHLVFKGTRKYGVGEIAALVEGSGGELNAYTSFDQTVFYVTIASERGETALDVISEMMGHPRFDAAEIDNEREVVIEEIKRGHDSPGRRSSQLMFSTAYRRHPYGRPVIGFDKVVRGVSPKILKKYFKERYCPRNMFLVVAGDFAMADMTKKVETYFGDFEDNKVRKVKRPKEAKQTKDRVQTEKTEFKESFLSLSWKMPGIQHKDVPAMDVLALILGQGDSSRLVQRLRIDEPLVNTVGASSFTPLDDGLFGIMISLETQHSEKTLRAIHDELNRIRREGPNVDELRKAVTCLASDQVYSLESVDGLARSFGSMEFYFRDPKYFPKFLKQLSALDAAEIRRVANKYLRPGAMNITMLVSGDDAVPEAHLKWFLKAEKTTERKLEGRPPKGRGKAFSVKAGLVDSVAKTEKRRLSSGGLVLLRRQGETPTTSARFVFAGGPRLEKESQEGLTELFSRVWMGGGKKFDEATLNHEVDSMAAGLSTFGGRNTVGLSADYISQFDDRLSEIINDLLLDPAFPEEVLLREKTILKSQIRSRNDNPSQICIRQFSRALFEGHPYSRDLLGNEKSLDQISRQDLVTYARQIFTKGNLAVGVVGDMTPTHWMKRIESIVESLPAGNSLLANVPHAGPRSDIQLFHELKKEQAHLVLGYRGLDLRDPRRYALQVIQAILAGQGGRLFIELRDKKSLAYSVSPLKMEGLGTGYFGAYIGCSPEKTATAEKMIREEFQKLCDKLVPEDELERARRYLSGRTAIDLQRKSAVCNAIIFDEFYGLDAEESLRPAERYASVTAKEVRELAKAIFGQPSVLSVVGPERARIPGTT